MSGASGSRAELTTIRFFEELYAIVVGLGLALAVAEVVDLQRAGIPVAFEHLPLFGAFISFAFPLAHSSVRYLDLAYVDREVGPLGKGRVIADLGLGTGQFLFVMGLSSLITRPRVFAVVAILLLIGRPGRDLLLALLGRRPLAFDREVARIHGITIVCLLALLAAAAVARGSAEIWILRLGALTSSLVFALGLYLRAFDYFFSRDLR